MNETTKKCINYCRVSSREQEESGYSLDSQQTLLKDYSLQKGFQIKKVFSVSESASGHKQRQVFGEMLEMLKKERIKIIICEKVDRLTRNLKDAVQINEWINEDPEREVHFAKENWILTKDSKSGEKFIWNVRVSVAQYYTDNLSEEVKKGQKEKIKQGWLPTQPPRGYKTVGEKGHKIHVIDHAEVPLIKKAFDLYSTGDYSLQTALNMMTELGLRTRSGNKMAKSRFAALLSNPFYIGKVRWNNVIYKGSHDGIIEKEVYDAVQDVMRRKSTPVYSKHFYLFKGLIKCSVCGGSITWQIHKGWVYGYCNGYKGCPKKSAVREDKIDEVIIDLLGKTQLKDSRLFDWAEKAIKHSHQEKASLLESSTESLNQRLKQLEARFEKLYDDKIDGKITESFYESKLRQYQEEKEQVLSSLSKNTGNDSRNNKLNEKLFVLSQRAKELYASCSNIDKKRQVLKFIYKSILLENDRTISTEYTDAFKLLVETIDYTNGSNFKFFDQRGNKKFEPSKNPLNETLKGPFDTKYTPMLRDQDSNLEPIDYTYPNVSKRGGLYHSRPFIKSPG
jgi:DNA invertase Pin-like site-specific DNA recombinase